MNVGDIIGQNDLIGGGNIPRLQVDTFTASTFHGMLPSANNNNNGKWDL